MEEPQWPEFHILDLSHAKEVLSGWVHKVFDHLQNPTPSEHFQPESPVGVPFIEDEHPQIAGVMFAGEPMDGEAWEAHIERGDE